MGEITKYEAYQFQLGRLTEDQKLALNAKEKSIGRKLLPYEIAQIFKLEPAGKVEPRKRRMSDTIEESWTDNL